MYLIIKSVYVMLWIVDLFDTGELSRICFYHDKINGK